MSLEWLRTETQARLEKRDYAKGTLGEQVRTVGVDAGKLIGAARDLLTEEWIPGVEIFPRAIYPQRHRGFFGEFAREGEGVCGKIGFWPKQWATARMYAGTAKGFHIHPPCIPAGVTAADWSKRCFIEEPDNFALRNYRAEQWDMMFFIQGTCEFLLVDERAGLPRRIMRLWIDGDDLRGPNNVGLIIPPGVAHALRGEGSKDLIMVYGTSTCFNPDWEGRIASDIERALLPPEWENYLG
jgi:dTDP-4-dehydrorhamnose 3,5-epimerase-like enzyme